MANAEQARQQEKKEGITRAQQPVSIQRTRGSGLAREPYGIGGPSAPFASLRRIGEEMDRLFASLWGRDFPSLRGRSDLWQGGELVGWPEIEVRENGDRLIVNADVPGLKAEDLSVEVREDELCISGERRSESERREEGYFASERSYGSFCRTIPLPEGAKTDAASASFENGVLRVEIEVPGLSAQRGRRIEIRDTGSTH
jgi:HSP20 family protein